MSRQGADNGWGCVLIADRSNPWPCSTHTVDQVRHRPAGGEVRSKLPVRLGG